MTPKMGIYDLYKELGLEKKYGSPEWYSWSGVYGTGDFKGVGDYNAGILAVGISPSVSSKDQHCVQFSISTIDDGGWHAYDMRDDYTLEEALSRVDEIANSFIDYMGKSTSLPSEEELNKFLSPLKLWGEYTG